jgi:sugar transferase EpsL
MKKIIDFSLAGIGLVLLFPLMLLIAFLLRIDMGTPVFFKQLRPGKSEKPFYFYKFRTMTFETNEQGELLPDAMRLTKLGQWLRKTSLDELPQLWNVIKGDLSLVGPRPLLMEYLPLYTAEQRRRHEVKPGITGWAQVNGRNAISWEEKLKLDQWYVDHRSFLLDLKILWITFTKVLKRKDINQVGHVTMEKFRGTSS